MIIGQKTGNSAYKVEVVNQVFFVTIENDTPKSFGTWEIAYDWCLGGYGAFGRTIRGYSYLNAAYDLKDWFNKA